MPDAFYSPFTQMKLERIYAMIRPFVTRIIIMLLSVVSLHCAAPSEPSLPTDSCQNLIDNFVAARNVYTSDPTNRDKCIAVKAAGAALLDCPSLSTSEKNDYKAAVDAIYCN
jgi:hypothetical protein